jgi:hypothetical protein
LPLYRLVGTVYRSPRGGGVMQALMGMDKLDIAALERAGAN